MSAICPAGRWVWLVRDKWEVYWCYNCLLIKNTAGRLFKRLCSGSIHGQESIGCSVSRLHQYFTFSNRDAHIISSFRVYNHYNRVRANIGGIAENVDHGWAEPATGREFIGSYLGIHHCSNINGDIQGPMKSLFTHIPFVGVHFPHNKYNLHLHYSKRATCLSLVRLEVERLC